MLKVLILGGTGRVGSAVARALCAYGADLQILCRSETAKEHTEQLGAKPVDGDMACPEKWAHTLTRYDAVIHAAATFGSDMAAVDAKLISALLGGLSVGRDKKRLIYTGGGWLFGNTSAPTTEAAAYAPPREWQWMAENGDRVVGAADVEGLVIHPANVVDEAIGVPPLLLAEAEEVGEVRVPASLSATWPLVERRELGELYALALDRSEPGETYIGASEPAVSLARIAEIVRSRAKLMSPPVQRPLPYWMKKYGPWASGYGLSQHLVPTKAQNLLGWKPGFRLTT